MTEQSSAGSVTGRSSVGEDCDVSRDGASLRMDELVRISSRRYIVYLSSVSGVSFWLKFIVLVSTGDEFGSRFSAAVLVIDLVSKRKFHASDR